MSPITVQEIVTPMPGKKPKAKMGRPETGRDDATVRMDRTLARKLRHLALAARVPVAQYLSELVRSHVEKAYSQLLREEK